MPGKYAILTAFALVAGIGSAPAGAFASGHATNQSSVDPLSLYGDRIEFDVYRKGDKVGFHRVAFRRNGNRVLVRSNFELKIDLLFFTAFRYRYFAEGEWLRGKLNRLQATVDDDGEIRALTATGMGNRLTIEGVEGSFDTRAPLFPTNHWNAAVVRERRVLNTLTGKINNVRITASGRERIATERGSVWATRYLYSGDLDTEVWYDDAGRWVKMRFKGRDGSTIEYTCRRCQGASPRTAQQ